MSADFAAEFAVIAAEVRHRPAGDSGTGGVNGDCGATSSARVRWEASST